MFTSAEAGLTRLATRARKSSLVRRATHSLPRVARLLFVERPIHYSAKTRVQKTPKAMQ
jgi:hypothetical protein